MSCAGPRLVERPPELAQTQQLAAEMFRHVFERNKKISTLKASVRLRMTRAHLSRSIEQAILIKRPESLRLDSFNMLGELLYQLVYHDGDLHIVRPQDHYYRHSLDATALLREELHLDIDIRSVIQLLSGGIPLEEKQNYLAVSKQHTIILRGESSQLILDKESLLPQRYMAYTVGGSLYEVSFADYRSVAGVSFPYQIFIQVSRPRVSLRVAFSHVTINERIGRDRFRPWRPGASVWR